MKRWIFLLLSFVLFASFVVKFALSFLVASLRVLPSLAIRRGVRAPQDALLRTFHRPLRSLSSASTRSISVDILSWSLTSCSFSLGA